ncbi:MAG: phosphoribosylformylglycinamidine cyclo-ligase [Saprospiraceae bacterium]|nr:phosphoribosylformylglycinamidine cyclo-ligase [Saprospiraceae bacterium]
MSANRYEQRGVSADKGEVHHAIQGLDKGIFPNAFCKILPDVVAGDTDYCCIMHADTAGTKTSLAYLYWKETGDLSVWAGIVQDALVMNLDDMACAGCTDQFVVSSTIGRNKKLVTGEVLQTLIGAAQDFANQMKSYGVNLYLAGGETADVGDIVRTADVGFTVFSRLRRSDVISVEIKEGDYIIGFAGYGQTLYEKAYNGGMGSNGLTSARHDIFSSIYRTKYPETFDPSMPQDLCYSGKRQVEELVTVNDSQIPLGKLVLSPTRTFLPFLNKVIPAYRSHIHGIIHNTGGGLYKVEKFLPPGLTARKDHLLPVPPLFQIIREESGSSPEDMARVFNMGTRLEMYVNEESIAQDIIREAKVLGIEAQIIGRVIPYSDSPVEIKLQAF